jgi:hypothetical protein
MKGLSGPSRNFRSPHPDDVLRRLARGSGPRITPSLMPSYRKPRDMFTIRWIVLITGILGFAALLASPWFIGRHRLRIEGLASGSALNESGLTTRTVRVVVKPVGAAREVQVILDGLPAKTRPADLKSAKRGEIVVELDPTLLDGTHHLLVRSGSRLLWRGPAERTLRFTVDRTPPELSVTPPDHAVALDQPVTFSGTVDADASVTVNGRAVPVANGTYTATFDHPPIGLARVVAIDPAGNRTMQRVRSRVTLPHLRAVHVSAAAWVTPSLKDPVMKMIDDGRINAVQLDLKDESGKIGYVTGIKLAEQIGSGAKMFDLRSAVAELHAKGVRVVGRQVVFRDPVFASHADRMNLRSQLVQYPDGTPYKGKYGGFTNPFDKDVRAYNIAVAREAAELGVDDILFDYIRRPEGAIQNLRFPGMKATEVAAMNTEFDQVMAAFLHETASALSGTKVRLGVSVFGIAAIYPDQIGQNVTSMASEVDYVAPMVYPSHFSNGVSEGKYGVKDPVDHPYELVKKSLADFQTQVASTDAAIVPWLQDFSLGRDYGAKEVRAQIKASDELGLAGFLLWDPKVTYHAEGVPKMSSLPGPSAGATAGR